MAQLNDRIDRMIRGELQGEHVRMVFSEEKSSYIGAMQLTVYRLQSVARSIDEMSRLVPTLIKEMKQQGANENALCVRLIKRFLAELTYYKKEINRNKTIQESQAFSNTFARFIAMLCIRL